jgi:iron complex outermembrane receptor protein
LILATDTICRILIILMLLLLSPSTASPEEQLQDEVEDFADLDLEQMLDVVFTAAKHEQDIGQSPSAITVISREDINTSGATTVPDLLRLVPGMSVIVSSPFFTAITTRLFWTDENNHFLVLIDGREANFDPLGFPPWEVQPIALEDIERIEIIRGPGSALYGANALAGVVSITTRSVPEGASGWVRMDAGEVGRTISGVRASARLGEWGISVGAGTDFSGMFSKPSQNSKEIWKFRALAERRWSESERLLLDLGISRGYGPMTSPMGTVECMFAPNYLRAAYESAALEAQLYWTYAEARADIRTPLEYGGMELAYIKPATIWAHIVDGQIQWTLPKFLDKLLLITGGAARVTWLWSDVLLDAETFDKPGDKMYHEAGLDLWEIRAGAFLQAEFAPTDWLTLTGGSRFDYNTQTGFFPSPRLAAVFRPAKAHFFRVGVARSFRKPAFLETVAHLDVEFPDTSPIIGQGRENFREFMTRVGGNTDLEDEYLTAVEAGYLGRFLDGRLSVSLDCYLSLYRNQIAMDSQIREDAQGLPDLNTSTFMFQHVGADIDVLGGELSVRYTPASSVSLLASWSHRQIINQKADDPPVGNPINQLTLGGRFQSASGLLGSLYAFSRSEVLHTSVENPGGMLEPLQTQHIDHVILLLGRIGWRFELDDQVKLEVGGKLFLPISPFSGRLFQYYEAGGGTTAAGRNYGAQLLTRMVLVYLEGSL